MGSDDDGVNDDGPRNVEQKFRFPIKPEIDYEEEKVVAPWMTKETSMIISPRLKLHNEVVEFCSLIEPT